MATFAEQIEGIEIPDAGALEPGRIVWLHGVKQAKTPGVFYAKDLAFSTPPDEPWAPDDRFDDEAGFSAPLLHLAVIGERSQWFIPADKDLGTQTEWLPTYAANISAKKITEWLVLVEGINEPMVLSASGKHKAGPFTEAFQTYRTGLLTQASRVAKKQMPKWSFWLPFRNKLDAQGKTLYLDAADGAGKTYGSVVTPPVLALPKDALDALFVGAGILALGEEIKAQYETWFTYKRLGRGEVEGQVISVSHQLAAPRDTKNLPVPLTEDEIIPF